MLKGAIFDHDGLMFDTEKVWQANWKKEADKLGIELPEEFIKEMHEEVCISLGHTAADYDCASRAMKLGAHHVTHLYNAM